MTYDCVIIGGGPGGICAGIYAIRAGMKTILVEKLGVGGQIAVSDIIENYPGFPSVSGPELMAQFEKHAQSVGLEIKFEDVTKIDVEGDLRILRTGSGNDIQTKTVIICSGAKPKRLGFAGEEEFVGRGVSNCATCDGAFYRGKPVAVIGGGDTAVKESIYLSRLVDKVYHVHRRDRLRAEKVLIDRIMSRPNIEFLWKHTSKQVLGDESGVTGLKVADETGAEKDLKLDGIFVFVGIEPYTVFIECQKDAQGFIITNEKMETSIPGVFAAGDCRVTPLRQVATAVGDASIAATVAEEYVSAMEGRSYEKAAKA
ncbi:MAG: thioredoxin-disulfide reductase [Nitrospinota bacterium]|nr:thioredoxin-disulfide reductase [Nitrospinota bacterium]